MASTNLIFFTPGCYGTFIEWALNFVKGSTTTLPFEKTGSSHEFLGNLLYPPGRLFEYVDNKERNEISRCHPNLFDHLGKDSGYLQEDIKYLQPHFDNILSLIQDERSRLWVDNNVIDKCFITEQNLEYLERYGLKREDQLALQTRDPVTKINHFLERETHRINPVFTKENLQGWNKDSIFDFDHWELRELLSLYWFCISDQVINEWKTFQPTVDYPIFTIESLRELDTFITTVLEICKHFDITALDDRLKELEEIYPNWRDMQIHMDKDKLCEQIVTSVLMNEHCDWSKQKLSIIDEAWIQKQLREQGHEIKCYNLNVFPTNSKDLRDATK